MTVQDLKDWFYDTFGRSGHKDMAKVLRLAGDADNITIDHKGIRPKITLSNVNNDTDTEIITYWNPVDGLSKVQYPLSRSRR